jgi:acyl dehydratase
MPSNAAPADGAYTPPSQPRYFEDFVVGEVLVSPEWEATEEEIVWFAQRYDPQYYHLDPARARDSIFGGLVAGGFQTASLTWGLALRTGMFEGTAVAGLGIDSLRWHEPMRAGDKVRVEFSLVEGRPSRSRPGLAAVTFAYAVRNQADRTLLTLKMSQLVRCRPSAGA